MTKRKAATKKAQPIEETDPPWERDKEPATVNLEELNEMINSKIAEQNKTIEAWIDELTKRVDYLSDTISEIRTALAPLGVTLKDEG